MSNGNDGGHGGQQSPNASSTEFSLTLIQTARSLRTVLSRKLVSSHLYAGQDGVILALAESDGMTAGRLAQKLGVKASTMTRTLGRMEQQGFVSRQADAEDARLTKVYLTDAGRNSIEAIEEATVSCDRKATEGFSEKETRELTRLLKAVDANLM